jgi:hypothetical protein
MFNTTQQSWEHMQKYVLEHQGTEIGDAFTSLMQDYTKAQIVIKSLDNALIEVGKRGDIPHEEIVRVLQEQYDKADDKFKEDMRKYQQENG